MKSDSLPTLRILGIRGIPCRHGGFETFAEHLAQYLVRRGWQVTVYCQEEGRGRPWEDAWEGVRRIHVPVSGDNAWATIRFDFLSVLHASRFPDPVLTLGYNTAVFSVFYRVRGIRHVMNMDGIEWKREKWKAHERLWLRFNEWAGKRLADHLIADHPEIQKHLMGSGQHRIAMIPYGGDEITQADQGLLRPFFLLPGQYALVVARPEPENSILEIVRAFSRHPRGIPLVVLGNFKPGHPYHDEVRRAASKEVVFPGSVYEREILQALRFHARVYLHGHKVGGTNPSLVEALGAGSPVVAHDNPFNRWVAGSSARYFSSTDELADVLDSLLGNDTLLAEMGEGSRRRFREKFRWEDILQQYERLLLSVSRS